MGPTPPEWLEQDAVKLGPSSDPGKSSPPSQGKWVPGPGPNVNGWACPCTHLPRDPLLEGKQKRWEALTQDSQGVSDHGGL